MRLWLVLALIPFAACARHSEENLGLKEKPAQVTIDLSKVSQVSELEKALSLPPPELDRALGPHQLEVSASLKIQPAGQPLETLDEHEVLDSDGHGDFHLTRDNTHERGMEAVLTGGALYVRPRYGKFVRRRPEPGEPARLRLLAESTLAGYIRVLERSLLIRPLGPAQFQGRRAVRLQLAAAPTPTIGATRRDPAQQWRQTVRAKYIEGEILLDASSGAPLSAKLDASYSFTRGSGERIETVVHAEEAIASLPNGEPSAPSDFVDSPVRTRPMLDRQVLLNGLGGAKHER